MSDTYKKLNDFISKDMRMSHIYQPLMLIELLKNNGTSTITNVAKALLLKDVSQIEYYENITKNMVGKVLTNNRKITTKDKNSYSLLDYDKLSEQEIENLINLCIEKASDYTNKRGDDIWSHRKKSKGYISGSTRYEVLKNAKFHCQLCGISAEKKALEVDHIVPRTLGGKDEMYNFQALCYSCNAMKGDRDNTDFRNIIEDYNYRVDDCPFCESIKERIIDQNDLCYVVRDQYPVTELHSLIIPKRHVEDPFDLYLPEQNSVNILIKKQKEIILKADKTVEGFNVGFNSGIVAGQTVMHCHIHLIPRRKGDIVDPKGGIRGVIPSKKAYND